jgi:hypothetical protein
MDDVALSCGGQIISNISKRDAIMVLNVFRSEEDGGDNYREGGTLSRAQDYIKPLRSMEDEAAWACLGIEPKYLDLPEALLRNEFPFSIFLSLRSKDREIADKGYDRVRGIVALHPEAEMYFPAGFGNHRDHLLCREVAFRLLDNGDLDRIFLYEDIPYAWLKFIRELHYRILMKKIVISEEGRKVAFRKGGLSVERFIKQDLVPFPRGKMLFLVVYLALIAINILSAFFCAAKKYRGCIRAVTLNDEMTKKKVDLIQFYESQIPLLFGLKSDECLRAQRESLSTEVLIEIVKAPS